MNFSLGFRKFLPLIWVIAALVILIITGIRLLNNPPLALVSHVVRFACPNAIYAFETTENVIALTIDDVPDPRPRANSDENNSTAKILDALRNYNAKATFFVITKNLNNRENFSEPDPITRRIVEEGHELGNHLRRDEPSIHLGNRFGSELRAADQALRVYLNDSEPLQWLRPGGGWCTTSMQNEIAAAGYEPAVLGSVWPYDTFVSNEKFIKDFVKRNVHPGAIVILHDGGTRGDRTAKLLPELLAQLTNNQDGQSKYQIVTLSELLARSQKTLFSAITPPVIDYLVREPFIYAGDRVRSALNQPVDFFWQGNVPVWRWILLLPSWGIAFIVLYYVGKRDQPFLKFTGNTTLTQHRVLVLIRVLILPAALEEIIMRGFLLPSASELSNLDSGLLPIYLNQIFLSTTLYIIYHPLLFGPLFDIIKQIWFFIMSGNWQQHWPITETFWHPAFLVSVSVVGTTCATSYLLSGSLLPPIIFHGLVVWLWLEFLGGENRLRPN